tara:strand:- start:392 stop:688 length:297 start_codon:yes stop_codon:yes gene_type:complete
MKLKKIPRSIKYFRSFEVIENKKRELVVFPTGVLAKTKKFNIRLSRLDYDYQDKIILIIKYYKNWDNIFYVCLINNRLFSLTSSDIEYFIKPHIRNTK